MSNLDKIEGIGPAYMAKLKEAGINSTEQLLEKGANPAGRKELETATGISHSLILRWLNNADLFRIKGIGSEYADLLEAAGVNTVPELAQRSAENLTAKMAEINEVKKLVRKVPTASQVTDWVAQAKALPRVLTY